MLSTTHRLADGSRVRLRLTRPSDLPRIAALLGDDLGARRFAFYDPRERVVIAATRPGSGGEEIAGLAAARLDERDPVAVVAEGAGLRGLLRQAALELARQRRRHAA